jgi:hypothetical protein
MLERQTVEKMRELLSDPEHWTKEHFAKDASGFGLSFGDSPDAVYWCLLGSLEKVNGRSDETEDSFRLLFFDVIGRSPVGFNDSPDTSHEDVLAALDRLIKTL